MSRGVLRKPRKMRKYNIQKVRRGGEGRGGKRAPGHAKNQARTRTTRISLARAISRVHRRRRNTTAPSQFTSLVSRPKVSCAHRHTPTHTRRTDRSICVHHRHMRCGHRRCCSTHARADSRRTSPTSPPKKCSRRSLLPARRPPVCCRSSPPPCDTL